MRIAWAVSGIALFVLSLLVAYRICAVAPTAAAASIGAGLIVSVILFFLSALWRRLDQGGGLSVGPQGVRIPPIDWTVRNREPLSTYAPPSPTNSTTNVRARELCDAGRQIVYSVPTGQAFTSSRHVDLDKAFDYFRRAAELDPSYWEPRLNMAQILLIRQNLTEALALASDLRIRFSADPLAYSKATLIVARVLEMRIPKEASKEELRTQFEPIIALLRDSLQKCPGHMVTRTVLGKALVRVQAPVEEKLAFLRENLDDRDFKSRFREALAAEQEPLLAEFEKEFPGLLDEAPKGDVA